MVVLGSLEEPKPRELLMVSILRRGVVEVVGRRVEDFHGCHASRALNQSRDPMLDARTK